MSPPPRSAARPTERIAKLLARAGVASRREIERMIAEGRIALNGEALTTPATLLTSLAGITVDGNPVAAPAPARLFAFHKPSGVLTAERDFTGRPTIYDRLPPDLPRVVPVGRLDLNTEGLLLLTTDGGLKRQLELPSSGVERSYRARAYGEVSQAQLEDLMDGVEVEGVRYGSIDANLERRTGANVWIELTLTEGKNREVRRVLEHLGLRVSRLIRTRYGPFLLDDLGVGEVVEIRQHDLVAFRKQLALPPERRQATPPEPITPAVNRAARRAELAKEREEEAPARERPTRSAASPTRKLAPKPRRAGDARPSRPAAKPAVAGERPRQGLLDPEASTPERPRASDARKGSAPAARGNAGARPSKPAEQAGRSAGDQEYGNARRIRAGDRPAAERSGARGKQVTGRGEPRRGDLVDRPRPQRSQDQRSRPGERSRARSEAAAERPPAATSARGRAPDRTDARPSRGSTSPGNNRPPRDRTGPGKPRPGSPRRPGPSRPRG